MSSVLCGRYTDGELKSDIFQVGHHGYWGGSPELHRKVSPQILLWPSPDFRFPMILRHPADELPNYRQPRMPEESLRRMWEINDSLVSLPSVRVTGYGGSEQFTVNMSKFDRSPDPWASPRDFISTTLPLSVPADGLLRRDTPATPGPFDIHWRMDAEPIVRKFLDGDPDPAALWGQLSARLREKDEH